MIKVTRVIKVIRDLRVLAARNTLEKSDSLFSDQLALLVLAAVVVLVPVRHLWRGIDILLCV